jgi:hypothetical protein
LPLVSTIPRCRRAPWSRGDEESARRGEGGDDRDRRARTCGVSDDAGKQPTEGEPGITPEAIDADGWGSIPWLYDIRHGGDESRIDERRTEA